MNLFLHNESELKLVEITRGLIAEMDKLKNETESKLSKTTFGSSLNLSNGVYFLNYNTKDGFVISKPKLKKDEDEIDYYYDFLERENFKSLSFNKITQQIEEYLLKKEKVSDNKGSIYLVTDGKYTKIGATSYNVNKRLSELQTGNAKKLKLIYSYKVKNKFTTESFLHDLFKEKNVLNEWFELSFKDIDKIMNEKYDVRSETVKISKEDIKNIENTVDSIIEDFNNFKTKIYSRHNRKNFILYKNFAQTLSPKEAKLLNIKEYKF